MLLIYRGHNTGLYPPNMNTLSSEILVNEKFLHGGGVLPVTVGLDQHPADKHSSVYSQSHNIYQYVTLLQDITLICIIMYLIIISLEQ